MVEEDSQADEGAAFGRGGDGKNAANVLHPFAHVAQSVPGTSFFPLNAGDAAAIVLNFQCKGAGIQTQAYPRGGGVGVADDVGDGFLGGEEDVMADFRGNGGFGQAGRDVEPVAHARDGEVILGVLADVVDEAFEGVVGGIDGPDDFVERTGDFAGGLGNLAGVVADVGGGVLVDFHHFTEHGDLGEAGAELIVDVAGDAGAFLFEGLLLAEAFELALEFLGGKVMDDGNDDSQQTENGGGDEGRGAPERRQNGDGEGGTGWVPHAVFVASGHLKVIFARGQAAVVRGGNGADFGPADFPPVFMAFEAIFEADLVGGGEVEAGVLNIETFLARGDGDGPG